MTEKSRAGDSYTKTNSLTGRDCHSGGDRSRLSQNRRPPIPIHAMTPSFLGKLPDGREARLLHVAQCARASAPKSPTTVAPSCACSRRIGTGNLPTSCSDLIRVEDYVAHSPYFGCVIGRCGNRIAAWKIFPRREAPPRAKTTRPAESPVTSTAGCNGFDKVMWRAEPFSDAGATRAAPALSQCRRRGRLSGQSRCHRHVHAHRRKRAAHRLRGNHGSTDARQSDQPLVFQSRGRRLG